MNAAVVQKKSVFPIFLSDVHETQSFSLYKKTIRELQSPGCDKDGVHLPQTSGFGQWTSGLSILLVLWTSE